LLGILNFVKFRKFELLLVTRLSVYGKFKKSINSSLPFREALKSNYSS